MIIGANDAILIDKQTHFSVQNALQLINSQSRPIRMLKHSNMAMLRQYIQRLKNKYEKIWYFADGIYSMFGDILPYEEINELMDEFEQLHLYVDDAHGFAWCGEKGSGSIYNKIKHKDRFVLAVSLNKAFGSAGGGIVVFPNTKMYETVQKFGGPLSYSHPLSPPAIGASMASVEIMLSEEGELMQSELRDRIEYCDKLLNEASLPMMSSPDSAIKFLAVGDLEIGYKLIRKMINEGYFVNIAMFPAVSINNTGMRFSLNRLISMEHIKRFVELLRYHYFMTLKEHNTSVEVVLKSFKNPVSKKV